MDVEVLSFNGQKWVIGESLAKVAGITPDKFANWIEYQIDKRELVRKQDYIDYSGDILFTFEAAAKICEKTINKPKTGPRGNIREHGVKRDEYGLPVLPPPKRRGALINPYRI